MSPPHDLDTEATADDEAAAGELRFPGLQVGARLGAGGNGVVYRAWDAAAGRHVALKVLQVGAWGSEAQIARFRREVEIHRRIDDPGVVHIFADGATPDGAPWFTMELIDGPSLQDRIDRGARPPLATGVGWVRDVARTLARLHDRGVVHRDVKPANILLQDDQEPRLADFGVVFVADETRLTVGPRAVGTPRFMAPEQLAGAVGDWRLVDVYALGLVLAELLGPGRRPADLAYVVRRATAAAPMDRYSAAAAMADDLARWLAGRSVRTRAEALVWRLRRTSRTAALRLVAAVIAVVIAVVIAFVRVEAARRDERAAADWAIARAGLLRTWSTGDVRAADEWVSRFASDSARLRTPAAGHAWLALAALHRDALHPDEESDALGRALAATDDHAVRSAALAAVVAAHRRARRWPALAHLLRALPAEGITIDPEVRREAAAAVALAAGDVAAAITALPEHAALLTPFQALRSVPSGTIGALDSDGDGALEPVIAANAAGDPVRGRDEHGDVVWRFGPRAESALRDEGGRALLEGWAGLWSLSGAGAVQVGPASRFSARVGDRTFGVVRTMARSLAEYLPGGPVPADPATEVLSAYVQGAGVGDVDGDGQDDVAHGKDDADQLAHAVDLAIDGADATLARDLVDQLTALAPGRGADKAAELAAYLTPAWSLDLGRPLPAEVQVVVPPALRHDLANRELTVRAPSGLGPILRVPLRATGGPAWLHVAGVWTRSEWGCLLQVDLADREEPTSHLRHDLAGNGAGGVLFRSVVILGREQVARPDVAAPFDLRVSTMRAGTGLRFHGSFTDTPRELEVSAPVPRAGEAGELVITASGGIGTSPGPLCEAVLQRLEFGGFIVDPGPAAPQPAAVRWAIGEGSAPPGEPADDPPFVALLRLDATLQDRVRAHYGPDAADRLFHAAWDSAAQQHRADGRTIDAALGMGELAGVAPARRLWLRVARGEALLRSGRPADARTALEAAWDEAAAFGLGTWREAFEAAALLAELDLSVGDDTSAAAWIARATAVAPDADVGARMLRHRPRLAAAPALTTAKPRASGP